MRLPECIIKSGLFKEGDNLIQDSGFSDRNTINTLKKEGVNVYVRVKKNMDIYKEALALACKIWFYTIFFLKYKIAIKNINTGKLLLLFAE